MTAAAEQDHFDKLRAFELRMQTEGAAGFADGPEPWSNWQETIHEAGNRVWESAQRRDSEAKEKSLCEKLMTTMATVAVAALAVGIGGVYMTAQNSPRLADSGSAPATLAETAAPAELTVPADTTLSGTVIRRTPLTGPATTDPPAAASATAATDIARAPVIQPGSEETAAAEEPAAAPLAAQALPATVDGPPSAEVQVATLPDALPAPAAGDPQLLSMQTPARTATPVTPPVSEAKAAAAASRGIWVVNISSYRYESYARRKLQEFRNKGVSAEIHAVTVKGKLMYRIRTTGYETRKEAQTWVSLLQDRLGVDSAWVSKR
jgi:cell division septation protein DedD